MARDNELLIVSADGRAYTRPLGETAPTDATTVSSNWALGDLGWCHEDGLTIDYSEDKTEFTGWGTTSSLRTVTTKTTRTFKIVPLETSPLVTALYYKTATPTPDSNGAFDFPLNDSADDPFRAWMFDTMNGDRVVRYYIPTGQITGRGSIQHNQANRTVYELTIQAYPDDAGTTAHIFVEQPSLAA